MATETRPYSVVNQVTGETFIVRNAINPSRALRVVTRAMYAVAPLSSDEAIDLVLANTTILDAAGSTTDTTDSED
jgi:hypothetical protein